MKRANFEELPSETAFTNGEVLRLYFGLNALKGIKSLRFNSTLGNFLQELRPYAKALSIDSCITVYYPYQEFLKKIEEVGEKHQIRNNPMNPAYLNEVENLEKEYADVIREYNKENTEYQKYLNEDFDGKMPTVRFKQEHIPEDLPSETFLMIAPFIRKEEKDKTD